MPSLPTFFLLAYALTWLFWLPAARFGQDVTASLWLIPFLLGGFGPSAAALILAARSSGREGIRRLWRRTIDVRRIAPGWYAYVLLVIPTIIAVSVALSRVLGLNLPGFEALGQVQANPALLIGMVVFGFITGPLAEELGWRGYALDRLQQARGPLAASFVLAPIWWAWHLPLFFMPGTSQFDWGLLSVESLLYLLTIIPLTVVMTWLYNHTRRSILAPILLHFSFNFSLGLIGPMTATFQLLQFLGLTLAATITIWVTGRRG